MNEDKSLVLTCNGEVFNYIELRKELRRLGHRSCTDTDVEAILHGYEEWKEDVFTHLTGMFAFSIWDCKSQRLFLARDFLGIKPLYYRNENGVLLYASEIRKNSAVSNS